MFWCVLNGFEMENCKQTSILIFFEKSTMINDSREIVEQTTSIKRWARLKVIHNVGVKSFMHQFYLKIYTAV